MRAILVHNPDAGTNGHSKDSLMAALRLADIDARYVLSKDDGIKAALGKRADLIVVAGGDGTIGKVLTAMPDRSIPVGILPLGSANNIARSLAIAGTPQQLVESWHEDRTGKFDIGCVDGPSGKMNFVEAFGIGVIPRLILDADKRKKGEKDEHKPKPAGDMRAGRKALQKALKRAKPIDAAIVVDGRPFDRKLLGVEILNIPYSGPGLPLAHTADSGDGLLDVVYFEVKQRDMVIDWIDAPHKAAPPLTSLKGFKVELTWRNQPTRLDDEASDSHGKTQKAEICCSALAARILLPVIHPAARAWQRHSV